MSVDAGVDPFGGLTGDNRDAYVAITNTLQSYGLESLASTVLGYIQQGYSSDTINVLLQNSDAYKQRFAANEARKQNRLPVLSPAEYLATERAYRQVMSAAGLPVGFYDQPSDFESFLSNDVSPTEIQQRVQVASDLVYSAPQSVRDTFAQWYGNEQNMIAYMLDENRALPLIEKQAQAAKAGGYAADQGLNLTQSNAEMIGSMGLSDASLRQGIGAVSALNADTSRLSSIYGGDYTQADAVAQVFTDNQTAANKSKKLASQERAAFSGSSGIGRTSLGKTSAGQL